MLTEGGECTWLDLLNLEKMRTFEWLGQTIASLSWIVSLFFYGISSTGDWLQLLAASSWMVSNIASILKLK